ncbi:MAG: low molecular weight protein arginine phosphatase [Deltaproteobacteria bacterium]|nr:MAG: low molecular weight protein arginine phosphatase [Deltaproteobacteria bacterium]
MRENTAGSKAGSSKGPITPTNIRNILFVCTGNTCRSPLAAGFLKKLLERNSLGEMEIGSAGLTALPGSPSSFHSLRVALENSVSLEEHQARLVTAELIDNADLIVVMEPGHRQRLLDRYPQASDKIYLLRHFARYGSRERGINDPYGGNLEAYRFCFEDIKECVGSLHEWLLEASQS